MAQHRGEQGARFRIATGKVQGFYKPKSADIEGRLRRAEIVLGGIAQHVVAAPQFTLDCGEGGFEALVIRRKEPQLHHLQQAGVEVVAFEAGTVVTAEIAVFDPGFDLDLAADHFRAFADWWSVPPQAAFAEQGHWEPGPGMAFFDAVSTALGPLELVVEDLGQETEPLRRLREQTGLPQMRVLVQGLDEDGSSLHLPTAWTGNEAAYTDTHDYDTIAGWAQSALHAATTDDTDDRLARALRLTGASDVVELPRAAIETVMQSQARYAVAPLQDWLGMGSESRMNVPGTADGNWRWIAPTGVFDDELAQEIATSVARAGRTADA